MQIQAHHSYQAIQSISATPSETIAQSSVTSQQATVTSVHTIQSTEQVSISDRAMQLLQAETERNTYDPINNKHDLSSNVANNVSSNISNNAAQSSIQNMSYENISYENMAEENIVVRPHPILPNETVDKLIQLKKAQWQYQATSDVLNLVSGNNKGISAAGAYYLSKNDAARELVLQAKAQQQTLVNINTYQQHSAKINDRYA